MVARDSKKIVQVTGDMILDGAMEQELAAAGLVPE
jgi:hypothetical protein